MARQGGKSKTRDDVMVGQKDASQDEREVVAEQSKGYASGRAKS